MRRKYFVRTCGFSQVGSQWQTIPDTQVLVTDIRSFKLFKLYSILISIHECFSVVRGPYERKARLG
jgi:hypothetical protein